MKYFAVPSQFHALRVLRSFLRSFYFKASQILRSFLCSSYFRQFIFEFANYSWAPCALRPGNIFVPCSFRSNVKRISNLQFFMFTYVFCLLLLINLFFVNFRFCSLQEDFLLAPSRLVRWKKAPCHNLSD